MVTDEEEQALSGRCWRQMSLNRCRHWEEVVGDNGWRHPPVGDGDTHLQSWLDVLRGFVTCWGLRSRVL